MIDRYKTILFLLICFVCLRSNANTIFKENGYASVKKINSPFIFLNATPITSSSDEYKEINYPENIAKFRNSVIFSVLITIAFLINIPSF